MSSSLNIKHGSALGAILLITGSCVGAGMLAIPVITGLGGFLPAIALFILAWAFMTTTALLLLEANLSLGHHLSLISIAEKTLGSVGRLLAWILFLFLFYSLSIAYIAASGELLQSISYDYFDVSIPTWAGSFLFTLIFAVVVYMGAKPVDYLNRLLMLGLIIAYFLLVSLGSSHVQLHLLAQHQWKYAFIALPVLIISFGFHNMVPTLADYLKGDPKRLRMTVLIGSLIPLIIYLVWEFVMLGVIPVEGRGGLLQALDKGSASTQALRDIVGRSSVTTIAELFSLFAIITSFLAQSLSLVDFLADGLKIKKSGKERVYLVFLSLIPPFVFAFAYPGIFIEALNMAGGFSAVILFGAMPALMVWVLRYKRKSSHIPLVPFGRPLLVLILLISFAIFSMVVLEKMGLSLIPQTTVTT